MNITEVKVKLVEFNGHSDRLQAFCSITIDNSFVIRDLKVIEGAKGAFVAMPSRKIMERCLHCKGKNHLRARFCNECGREFVFDKSKESMDKLHADIAHPINTECRDLIQNVVLSAFEEEREQQKQSPSAATAENDFGNGLA